MGNVQWSTSNDYTFDNSRKHFGHSRSESPCYAWRSDDKHRRKQSNQHLTQTYEKEIEEQVTHAERDSTTCKGFRNVTTLTHLCMYGSTYQTGIWTDLIQDATNVSSRCIPCTGKEREFSFKASCLTALWHYIQKNEETITRTLWVLSVQMKSRYDIYIPSHNNSKPTPFIVNNFISQQICGERFALNFAGKDSHGKVSIQDTFSRSQQWSPFVCSERTAVSDIMSHTVCCIERECERDTEIYLIHEMPRIWSQYVSCIARKCERKTAIICFKAC